MKIDILSDIHLDMWNNPETALNKRKKKILFSKVLPQTPGETLVRDCRNNCVNPKYT